jgi:hypothetical protein
MESSLIEEVLKTVSSPDHAIKSEIEHEGFQFEPLQGDFAGAFVSHTAVEAACHAKRLGGWRKQSGGATERSSPHVDKPAPEDHRSQYPFEACGSLKKPPGQPRMRNRARRPQTKQARRVQ